LRYKKNIKVRLLKHRTEHLEEVNKKSSYKTILVKDKNDMAGLGEKAGITGAPIVAGSVVPSANSEAKVSKGETDLNSILKKRIESI
jgi:hypothetical protein